MKQMTAMQQDLLIEQTLVGAGVSTIGGYLSISVPLDLHKFREARNRFISGCDALSFSLSPQPNQFDELEASALPDLAVVDCRQASFVKSLPHCERLLVEISQCATAQQQAECWMQWQMQQAFDEEGQALFLDVLLQVDENHFFYFVSAHHAVMDGWSYALWVQGVINGYRFLSDEVSEAVLLNTQKFPFSRYLQQAQHYLNSAEYISDRAYWLKQCQHLPEPLFDHRLSLMNHLHDSSYKSTVDGLRSERFTMKIPEGVYEQLRRQSSGHRHKMLGWCLAALTTYFSQSYSQKKMVIGLPHHGRRGEMRTTVGMFVNIMPLVVTVDDEMSMTDLVAKIHRQTVSNAPHQYFPISHLHRALNIFKQDRQQLYDISFNYHAFNFNNEIHGQPYHVNYLSNGYQAVPLAFILSDYGEQQSVELHIDYRTDLWDQASVEAMAQQWLQLLNTGLAEPSLPITQLPLIERESLLQLQEVTRGEQRVVTQSVFERFEAIAETFPDRTAIVFHGEEISYAALLACVNKLADSFLQSGLEKGDSIGLLLCATPQIIMGQLAALKAAITFVPLLPDLPLARLQKMQRIAGLRAVMARTDCSAYNELLAQGAWQPQTPLSLLAENDIGLSVLAQEEQSGAVTCVGLRCENDEECDIAYILFTSGSTGEPKGVAVPEASLRNALDGIARNLNVLCSCDLAEGTPQLSAISVTSPSFDISLLDYHLPLLNGGRVRLLAREQAMDANFVVKALHNTDINLLQATPATWQLLLDAGLGNLPDLLAISGGEMLTDDLAQRLVKHVSRLFNGYGPTESTIYTLLCEVDEQSANTHLRGPLVNTQHYVLNDQGQPLAVGVPGELCIAGESLALGYINQPQLTQKSFVKVQSVGAHVYRTGDLVVLQPDGEFQFLGRKDQQVKVHGHRIELPEIEQVILSHTSAHQAVVIVDEQVQSLAAFVVLPEGQTLDVERFEQIVSQHVPQYMVPHRWQACMAFPLTTSGKVDKKRLLANAEFIHLEEAAWAAPTSRLEHWLLTVWMHLFIPEQVLSNAKFELQAYNTLRFPETHTGKQNQIEQIYGLAREFEIGMNSRFFSLGGNSLIALRIQNIVRQQLNVQVSVKRIFDSQTIHDLSAVIHSLLNNKDAERRFSEWPALVMEREELDSEVPLSVEQQRLWFIEQYETQGETYVISFAHNVYGTFCVRRFNQALTQIMSTHLVLLQRMQRAKNDREDIASATLDWSRLDVDEQGYLPNVRLFDLQGLDDDSKQQRLNDLLQQEQQQCFDLAKDPLIRAQVVALSATHHVLQLSMHHIVADGWSLTFLIKDLLAAYENPQITSPHAAFYNNRLQYSDYARWQSEWLHSEEASRHLAYWRQQLAGVPIRHRLPCDFPLPNEHRFEGRQVMRELSPGLTSALKHFAHQQQVSEFACFYAVYSVLMLRLGAGDDVPIGTIVANRHLPEVHDMVGMFVNTVVLRTVIDSEASFIDVLQAANHTIDEALAHQFTPFDHVIEALHPPRDKRHHPLFQVMIAMAGHENESIQGAGFTLERLALPRNTSKFDLTLGIEFVGDRTALEWEYRSDLFTESTINIFADCMETLIEQLVVNTQESARLPIAKVPILSEVRLQHVLKQSLPELPLTNQFDLVYQGVEHQAQLRPDHIAIAANGELMTYRELNEKANQWAAKLIEWGVVPDDLIAVYLPPSFDLVVSLLAIMKAGGAYLPLDTTYPAERLSYMLHDSKSPIVIARSDDWDQLREQIQARRGIRLFDVNADVERFNRKNPGRHLASFHHYMPRDVAANDAVFSSDMMERPSLLDHNHLCYVLYTSGSTGTPKGVMMSHNALMSHLTAVQQTYQVTEQDHVLQFSNIGFDPATEQIWSSLTQGATLYLRPIEQNLSADRNDGIMPMLVWDSHTFCAWLLNNRISVIDIPPGYAAQVLPPFVTDPGFWRQSELRLILIGGEAFPVSLLHVWLHLLAERDIDCQLFNVYGPTETCIGTHYHEISLESDGNTSLPLGHALPGTLALVLDEHGQIVPSGVVGELYLGGARLARGYHNRDEKNAMHFVNNPYQKPLLDLLQQSDEVAPEVALALCQGDWWHGLFRTGDKVRRLPNGELEFYGRVDTQVKLRGFRVELGEIEQQLSAIEGVQTAIVAVHNNEGDEQLVAWMVCDDHIDSDRDFAVHCRDQLARHLPYFMLPSSIQIIAGVPLNANGKVDFAQLPLPVFDELFTQKYVAPRNEIEVQLVDIWKQVLPGKAIGIDDNFFVIGGHSLLAMRVISAVREKMACELPIRHLFESPTIRQLSVLPVFQESSNNNATTTATELLPAIRKADVYDENAVSFSQQRLWFIQQLETRTTQYNMVGAFNITGELALPLFVRSVYAILQRHDVLRTTFHERDGRVVPLVNSLYGHGASKISSKYFTDNKHTSTETSGGLVRQIHVQHLPSTDGGQTSRFAVREGNACCVLPIEFRQLSEAQRQPEALQHMLIENSILPFDLEHDLMFRVQLLQLASREFVAQFTLHHIAADGWSIDILMREFRQVYQNLLNNTPDDLAPLPIQYADFAVWQRQWLQTEALQQQLSYWKRRLQGLPSVHNLPLDKPRLTEQRFVGAMVTQAIEPALAQQLQRMAKQQQVTVFMWLETVFVTLLHRYSNESDIVVGTSIAGRTHKELESLIGFFVNTLVLRAQWEGPVSFLALLQKNRSWILEAFANQHLPFDLLVEKLNPERSLSYNPVVQVLFSFQSNNAVDFSLPELSISTRDANVQLSAYDLALEVEAEGEGFELRWKYNPDLFYAETITHMSRNFLVMIEALLKEPELALNKIPMIHEEERVYLHPADSAIHAPKAPAELMHQWFEQQAQVTPGAIAVKAGEHELTYQDLNSQANQIARLLRSRGIGVNRLVGVCFQPSTSLMVALLGVLKSGAAYVPMDPSYPEDRLTYMMQAAQMPLVLTSVQHCAHLHQDDIELLSLDDSNFLRILRDFRDTDLGDEIDTVTAQHPAYMIYTSGSTGKPKGVLVPHRAVLDYCISAHHGYFASQDSRDSLVATSMSFDATVPSVFLPLFAGGCVEFIVEDDVIPALWKALSEAYAPYLVRMTPTHLRALGNMQGQHSEVLIDLEDDSDLLVVSEVSHHFVVGGEIMHSADLQQLRAQFPLAKIYNHYGPTEAIVGCCYFDTRAFDVSGGNSVPIGRPLGNAEIYVMRPFIDMQSDPTTCDLQPMGVTGEVYIGRPQLALGYHGQGDLTRQRFVPNPFYDDAGSHSNSPLLYRTGDLARWRVDGCLEYIGRNDNQVKLRGFRIELGEIESVLVREPSINACVVQVVNQRLVAYVVPDEQVLQQHGGTAHLAKHTVGERYQSNEFNSYIKVLKQYLFQRLPEYMRPAVFLLMKKLPLTPNGKVDRNRLPEPHSKDIQLSTYRAPTNTNERVLCELWQSLLGIERVGVSDNFFELGGDSIISIQVVSRARQQGMLFTVRQLFEFQTIESLLPHIKGVAQQQPHEKQVSGRCELTPIQTRFLERTPALGVSHFNQAVRLETLHAFSYKWLKPILREIYQRHDSLRLRFERRDNGEWLATYDEFSIDMLESSLQRVPMPSVPEEHREHFIQQYSNKIHRMFDVKRGPLLRVIWFDFQPVGGFDKPADGEAAKPSGCLMIIAHHLIVDGVSWRILFQDLLQGLEQMQQHANLSTAHKLPSSLNLAPKTSSYQRWAEYLYEYANQQIPEEEIHYWCQELLTMHRLARRWGNKHPLLLLGDEMSEPLIKTVSNVRASMDAELTQSLLGPANQRYRTRNIELLLSGVYWMYRHITGLNALVLDMEGHGRQELFSQVDISETLGWFSSHFPLILDIDQQGKMGKLLGNELMLCDQDSGEINGFVLGEMIKCVKEKFRQVPEQGIGFGMLQYLAGDPDIATLSRADDGELSLWEQCVFNYLGQFDAQLPDNDWLKLTDNDVGETISENIVQTGLVITAWVSNQQLQVELSFPANTVTESYQQRVLASVLQVLSFMAETFPITAESSSSLLSNNFKTLTPADFPNASMNQQQLNELPVPHHRVDSIYDTTPMQQGLLFHSLMDGSGASYTNQLYCDVVGNLDVSAFHLAWQEVVRRHAVFRTRFVALESETPQQLVLTNAPLFFAEEDWRGLSEQQQRDALQDYRYADKNAGFDLAKAPLIRVHLIRLSEDRYHLLWTHHHLLTDGWCTSLIFSEVMQAYGAYRIGDTPELPTVVNYENYLAWLRNQDPKQAKLFWKKQLKNIGKGTLLDSIEIAGGVNNPEWDAGSSDAYGEVTFEVPASLTRQLEAVASTNQSTLNVVLHLAWGYLLHRYQQDNTVVFGATVSGRPADVSGIEQIVGLFINTLPVRMDFYPELTIAELLRSHHRQNVARDEFAYLSLSDILQQRKNSDVGQLFDTLFVFENYPIDSALLEKLPENVGLHFDEIAAREHTSYGITLTVIQEQALRVILSYQKARFAPERMQLLLQHFEQILHQIATAGAQQRIADIQLLLPNELDSLHQWNETDKPFNTLPVVDQILENASQWKYNTAVIDAKQQLSYEQLMQRSEYLAHYLCHLYQEMPKGLGKGANTFIGLCVPRSVEMMIAIIAIQRAGFGYIPLDPSLPRERLQSIVEDAQVHFILSTKDVKPQIARGEVMRSRQWVVLDDAQQQDRWRSVAWVHAHRLPLLQDTDVAYMLYTSGSTGKPKGVVVNHRALSARIGWAISHYSLNEDAVFLQKTPFNFDVSMWEIFWPLSIGATVVMADHEGHKDPRHLQRLIQQYRVSIVNFVPSMLSAFLELGALQGCDSLQYVLASGEALSRTLVERFHRSDLHAELYNLYGPTEATVDVTCIRCASAPEAPVSIGHPIDNVQLYVLDNELRPVPIGVAGELYIAGEGIANGYWAREKQSKRAFLPREKFRNLPQLPTSELVYRSGDLVRWNDDGTLAYLGRRDHQIKIRGHRIELGEIENQLNNMDVVREAFVAVNEEQEDRKQLYAYVSLKEVDEQASEQADHSDVKQQMRQQLSSQLPDYMVPSVFIVVPKMPLSANGKVDRQRLLRDFKPVRENKNYQAPRNEVETALCRLWQQVLKIEQVGVDDNFFELGGDSIISIQLVAQGKKQGLFFSIRQLFTAKTVATLAPLVSEQQTEAQRNAAMQAEVTGECLLTPIQRTFFDWNLPEAWHFNQSVLLQTPEGFRREFLPLLAESILTRHDGLRLRFVPTGEGRTAQEWRAEHLSVSKEMVERSYASHDLSQLSGLMRKQALTQYCNEHQASLDIETGAIFTVVWFDYGKERDEQGQINTGRLLVIVHHLMVDGVSWRVLLSDLDTAYTQLLHNENIVLAPKTLSYQQWSTQMHDYAQSKDILREREYWLQQLKKPFARFPEPEMALVEAEPLKTMTFTLSASDTHFLLGEANQAYRTQINEVLLAALFLAYQRWSCRSVLRIDLEGHGREALENLDISDTVGWFTAIYPLVLEVDSEHVADVLKAVKEQCRRVPRKGVGFSILKELIRDEQIRALEQEQRLGGIIFNYLGQFDTRQYSQGGFSIANESAGRERSELQEQRAVLVVNGWVTHQKLSFEFSARTDHVEIEAITHLHELFEQSLHLVMNDCRSRLEQRQLFELGKDVIVSGHDQEIEGVEI